MDYLQFSLSYPFNRELDEAGNDDDSVEFISDLRVPCLICGNFKEIDNIIKEEVSENFGDNVNHAQGHNESVDVNVDSSVFNSFLKWFRVEIAKKGNQRLVNRGWDGEGGDILRFCANCKLELVEILEMQKQKERLEKNIMTGLEEVKVKMERSEKIFQINGIYENDKRYKLVRSSILKKENPARDNNHESSFSPQVDHSCSIKLSRSQTNTSDVRPDDITNTMTGTSMSSNLLSDISAGAVVKIPAKITQKNIPKKVTTRKPPEKNGRRKVRTRTSPRIKKKLVLEKVSSQTPSQAGENPVHKKVSSGKSSELNKAGHVEDEKTGSKSQRKTRKAKYAEFNLNDDVQGDSNSLPSVYTNEDQDYNFSSVHKTPTDPHLSSSLPNIKSNDSPNIQSTASAKIVSTIIPGRFSRRVKADLTREKVERKVCRRKSTRIAKKIEQSKYRIQKSARISKKVIQTEASGLKPAKIRKSLTISPPIPEKSLLPPVINLHTSRFACPKCLFKTDCKSVLDAHINCLHRGLCGPKLFPCSICAKPFANRRNRRNHEWTHMNKKERDSVLLNEPNRIPDWLRKNWPCDECEQTFPQARKLKRHKEIFHEGKPRDMCPKCGKAIANLRHHIRYNHVHKTRFQCTQQNCGKSFKMISDLTRHKTYVHSKVKPWRSTICTKEFAWKDSFKGHMELHVGVRSWKCKVKGCGTAFVTKWDLKKHNTRCHRDGGFYKRMANSVGLKSDASAKKGHGCHRVLRSEGKLRNSI